MKRPSLLVYLSKFLYILAGSKKYLIFLVILFLFTSLLETFGIGLIGPFIALATNLALIHQTSWTNWIYTQLGLESEIQFISLLGLVVAGILYFKSFLGFSIQKHIFEFDLILVLSSQRVFLSGLYLRCS